MKLPQDSQTGVVVWGVIITAVLALLAKVIPGGAHGGVAVDLVIIVLLWVWMFWLLRAPTPPRT